MKTEPTSAAFPVVLSNDDFSNGLTIRQHFAAMAMQGFCAAISTQATAINFDIIAKDAVKQADALIAELNKEKP